MNEPLLVVPGNTSSKWPAWMRSLCSCQKAGSSRSAWCLHEHITHLRAAQQEGAEGFREHIAWPHGVPNLTAQLVFPVAGRGHAAEVAVGEVLISS